MGRNEFVSLCLPSAMGPQLTALIIPLGALAGVVGRVSVWVGVNEWIPLEDREGRGAGKHGQEWAFKCFMLGLIGRNAVYVMISKAVAL